MDALLLTCGGEYASPAITNASSAVLYGSRRNTKALSVVRRILSSLTRVLTLSSRGDRRFN